MSSPAAILADLPAGGLRRLPGHPAALFGRGASARLADVLDRLCAQRCIVVRGRESYERSGAAAHIERALRGRPAQHIRSEPYQTTLANVASATRMAAVTVFDTVIGIGGGSTLDLAKAIAVLPPGEEDHLASVVRDGHPVTRACNLVLMPTTAGSGSELTAFAALWHGGQKLSLDAPALGADAVLVDPDLLGSVPRPVAVSAASDAICQAAESYWAVAGSDESRELAASAFRQLAAALAAGCAAGSLSQPQLQDELAWGASVAGAAIAISRTTAAHALSYPLTSRLRLPHGAAALLQLPWLIEHNQEVTAEDCRLPGGPERLRRLVGALTSWCHEIAGTEPARLVERLLRLGGFPASHAELADGPWQDDWLEMTLSARMANNPRLVTPADVRSLLSRRRTENG
jgi:alcohol dehydrogenase